MANSATSSTMPGGEKEQEGDLERQKTAGTISPMKLSKMRMVFDQTAITGDISHYPYEGAGTESDPYVVEWIPDDPRNPMTWEPWYKWFIALMNGVSTLSIAFVSS